MPSTLNKAWHYVRDDLRDDFIDDIIKHADYGQLLNQNIENLANKLSSETFYPTSLAEIEVPKSQLSIRPGSVPDIEDRIVAHAIVYLIAPFLDRNLSEGVYSFRLKMDYKDSDSLFNNYNLERYPFLKPQTIRKFKIHDEWYKQWPEYDEITRYMYEEEGYNYLAITDISAYFENIQHGQLKKLLLKYVSKEAHSIVDLLMNILKRWTSRSGTDLEIGRGIPQGTEIGSFLGNVYLIPLDKHLDSIGRKKDVRYFRYMDDIKIFTKNKLLAEEMVLEVERYARNLHLNLQGAKTEILENNTIRKRLFDPRLDALNLIYQECRKLKEKKRINLKKTFEKRFANACSRKVEKPSPQSNDRLLKRNLSAHKLINSNKLVPKALNVVCSTIEYKTLITALRYLIRFPKSRSIPTRLCSQLMQSQNMPPYWQASVVGALRFCSEIPRDYIGQLWNMLERRRTNWYVKVQITALLAQYEISEAKLRLLKRLLEAEVNTYVKRSYLFCLTQLTEEDRRNFLMKIIEKSDPPINRFISMVEMIANEEEQANHWMKRIRRKNITDGHIINNIYVIHLMGRSNSFRKVQKRAIAALKIREKLVIRKTLRNNISAAIDRLAY